MELERNESYLKSNYYEQIVEHVFISEVLQEAWFRYRKVVEVLKSEIDSSGYDVVLECNGYIRHIQLKTSYFNAKTAYQDVNIALTSKPSGCVVWILRHEDSDECRMKLKYRFFGGIPGEPLPSLDNFKIAKHTKANAQGIKSERPSKRKVPKGSFYNVDGISELLFFMFGLE